MLITVQDAEFMNALHIAPADDDIVVMPAPSQPVTAFKRKESSGTIAAVCLMAGIALSMLTLAIGAIQLIHWAVKCIF